MPLLSRPVGHELPVGRARDRISSYVYGNIIVLAATVVVSPSAIEHGGASLTVLATALTTFLAHVLAHLVGHQVGRDAPADRHDEAARDESRESVLAILRDAAPIATSGLVTALVLLVGALGWAPADVVLIVAAVYLIVRIAGVGFVVQRIAGRRPTGWGFWTGIVIAGFAVLIVAAKVAFAH